MQKSKEVKWVKPIQFEIGNQQNYINYYLHLHKT